VASCVPGELIFLAFLWLSMRNCPMLQKSLMVLRSSDSVAVMRFAMEEARDEGTAQSRPRAAVLFSP
jgi:hypothetical protein